VVAKKPAAKNKVKTLAANQKVKNKKSLKRAHSRVKNNEKDPTPKSKLRKKA
jgi:hypothetical protein